MATDFSLPKAKTFPIRPRSPWLGWLMQTPAFILGVNWCLQGMRGMGRKELPFRLLAEGLVVAMLMLTGVRFWPAVLFAHTFSYTCNGQVWVCARYARRWRRDPAALERFLKRTVDELRALPWLREAVCIGSRGDHGLVRSTRADLDLRLVFPPDLLGWLRTNLLLLRLRTRAFLALIPLDLYAYDDPEALARFDQRERLLVLLDRDGRLAARFPSRVVHWPS